MKNSEPIIITYWRIRQMFTFSFPYKMIKRKSFVDKGVFGVCSYVAYKDRTALLEDKPLFTIENINEWADLDSNDIDKTDYNDFPQENISVNGIKCKYVHELKNAIHSLTGIKI